MKNTVYVVTSGQYSDVRIEAIFTRRADAKDFINNNTTDFYLEEFVINEKVDHIKRGYKLFEVTMLKDGTVIDVERANYYAKCNEPLYRVNKYIKPAQLLVTTLARNKDHAIKIANERRTLALLNNEFVEYVFTKACIAWQTVSLQEYRASDKLKESVYQLLVGKINKETGYPVQFIKRHAVLILKPKEETLAEKIGATYNPDSYTVELRLPEVKTDVEEIKQM